MVSSACSNQIQPVLFWQSQSLQMCYWPGSWKMGFSSTLQKTFGDITKDCSVLFIQFMVPGALLMETCLPDSGREWEDLSPLLSWCSVCVSVELFTLCVFPEIQSWQHNSVPLNCCQYLLFHLRDLALLLLHATLTLAYLRDLAAGFKPERPWRCLLCLLSHVLPYTIDDTTSSRLSLT